MTSPDVFIVITANELLTCVVICDFSICACELRNCIEKVQRKEYHCGDDPLQ